MTLLLLEGFDDGLRDDRWVTSNLLSPASGSGENRFGLLQDFRNNTSMQRNLSSADEHATITFGGWVRPTNTPASTRTGINAVWQFRSDTGTTVHTTVTITPSLQLAAHNGDGTLLGTTDIIWQSTGTGKYVEIKVNLHDSTGTVTIWVDGNEVLALTGVDTKNAGTKTVYDAFKMSVPNLSRQEFELDDVYITNGAGSAPYNGRLGDVVVDTVFPDGNGTHSDFTGSDGNSTDNYLLVDESPSHDTDTTYVESGTNTDRDSYTFDDIVLTSGQIRGVIVTAAARNTGSADNLQVFARISTTNYDSATFAAPAGYDASVEQVWQVSPATSSNWTLSEVNAAEFGIENVA